MSDLKEVIGTAAMMAELIGKVPSYEVVHNMYESLIEDAVKDPDNHTACKKGCAFCCTLAVDMPQDEANYILRRVKAEFGDEFYKKVVELSKVKHERVKDLDIEARKSVRTPCVFLDMDKNTCKIYDYRPISCRSMYVAYSSDSCKAAYMGEKDVESAFVAFPKVMMACLSIALEHLSTGKTIAQVTMDAFNDQKHSWVSMEKAIINYDNKDKSNPQEGE